MPIDNAKIFERLKLQVNQLSDGIVQNAAEYIGVSLVGNTPVLTGKAVAEWEVTNGTEISSDAGSLDPGRERTRQRMIDFARKCKMGDVITWSNMAIDEKTGYHYPWILEYGYHSKQAPLGIVRLTAANARLVIPRLLNGEFSLSVIGTTDARS